MALGGLTVEERHIEVPRTARYHTLGRPGPGLREVWFVLHGYRQLAARFLRRFDPVDDGTRLIVAPEALSRFYVEREPGRHGPDSFVGATWMTRVERLHEIRDYVRYLDRVAEEVLAEVERSAVRLTVLGFSQGLHTAARWIVQGGWPPDRAVFWGDYLPPDLDMEAAAARFAGVDVVLVRGEEDPSRREELAADEAERLARWSVEHRILTHPGGHEIDPELLTALAREGAPDPSRRGG